VSTVVTDILTLKARADSKLDPLFHVVYHPSSRDGPNPSARTEQSYRITAYFRLWVKDCDETRLID
jgi:hypothetical protein